MLTVIRKKVRCLNCNKSGAEGAEITVKDKDNCGVIFTLCKDCMITLSDMIDGIVEVSK